MIDEHDLARFVYDVPGFPTPSVLFRDITPLLADAAAFGRAVDALAGFAPENTDAIAGMESRGFIFGSAVATRLRLPFVPIRKPGTLPRKTVSAAYKLEYGESAAHVHADSLASGQAVFLIDDLIATGGTLSACARVLEQLGAKVAMAACLIELADLGGRDFFARPLQTVLQY